jgi:hypothetical protein
VSGEGVVEGSDTGGARRLGSMGVNKEIKVLSYSWV